MEVEEVKGQNSEIQTNRRKAYRVNPERTRVLLPRELFERSPRIRRLIDIPPISKFSSC